MSHDADTPPPRIDAPDPRPTLEHVTIEPDDAPPECAIFPRDGTTDERAAQWITAQDRSFVDLVSMR